MSRRNITHMLQYRNPAFLNGKCACCRKRLRNFKHEYYPSMCDNCREVRIKDRPITRPLQRIPDMSVAEVVELFDELLPNRDIQPRTDEDRQKLINNISGMRGEIRAKALAMAGLTEKDLPLDVQILNKPVIPDYILNIIQRPQKHNSG